jgi:hypothetical protein
MSQTDIILKKLSEITEKEWLEVSQRCKKHILLRVGQKTLFGAHHRTNLEMSAFEYYFSTSVEKLYSGAWEWKFDKYSITEQLIRIIDSLISEEVRKYKVKKRRENTTEYIDDSNIGKFLMTYYSDEDNEAIEMQNKKIFEHISEAIKDKFELQYILECIREGKSYDEISAETGFDKKTLYKSLESIKQITRTYFKNNKISIEL